MKTEPTEQGTGDIASSKFNLLIGLLCGLVILAHFFASFFPKSRLWGINHLAYFPMWVRILFTLPGLLILIPWVNSRVYKILEQILSSFQRVLPKREVITASILAVVSMFFFWLLRTRTFFLGDGYAQISFLKSEQYLKTGFEALEIWMHLYLYKFLKFFFTPSAESIYVGLSIFVGGVFVMILFFMARTLSEDRFDRLFVFSLFIFSGATELFLGYAEHYTLLYTSIFAYLYFSVRYLQGKAKAFMPIVFCALSIGFHFSSAYLVPSLFFLLSLRKRKGELVFKMKKAMPYLLVMIFLIALSVFYIWSINPVLSDIFVPLFKGRVQAPDYTLFSFPHILDIINQHLLLSPVGIILLLSLAIAVKGSIRLKNPITSFLVLVSICQIFYHFVVDPRLGAGRDWDLMSNVALGYTWLGVYLFVHLGKSERYSAVTIIFAVLLCTIPWLLLNASTNRDIDRYKNLLDLDVKRSLNGRWVLTNYYNEHGLLEARNEVRAMIFKEFPEDSLVREAESYNSKGDFTKATELVELAIKLNPDYMEARHELASIYLSQGEFDKALEELEQFVSLNPYNPNAYQNLGYALLRKGRFNEALEALKRAVKLGGKNAEVLNNIAYTYWQAGDIQKAITEYKNAIKMDPNFYMAHFNLGQLYLQNRYVDQAFTEFQEVERLKPDYYPVYYNLGMVYAYRGMKDKAIEELQLFLKYAKNPAEIQKVQGFIQQLSSQKQ
jgi:tetratricopeptide (TPR) repeat protein